MFCCSATGEWLPPFALYKAKCMYQEWTQGGPKDAYYVFNSSRWMEDDVFVKFFIKVFLP